MAQAVKRLITTRRARRLRSLALVVLMLAPVSVALALVEPRLRDLTDPVPAGGILPYRVTLSDQTAATPPLPSCFNPPAECVTFPVTCFNPPPDCVGNPLAGFVCQNSDNDGTNCGVGTPPAPDPLLCIPRAVPAGVCNGGPNIGLPCTVPAGFLTTECPGFTFLCRRSYNEDAYCGTAVVAQPECVGDAATGFFCRNAENEGAACTNVAGDDADPTICQQMTNVQPRPENSFCLSNPTGICSGGPNFGLPCDTPHGEPSVIQCPPATVPLPPSPVTVELPMPTGTSFIDADNGGTPNGSIVTWTVPPLSTCGGVNQPLCAELNARLLIDSLVPEGTVFQNTATATDQDGFIVSGPETTLVARFLVRTFALVYPPSADARDRVIYRALFGLTATETINPGFEDFRFNVSTEAGTLIEFNVPAGQLPESNLNVWTYYPPAPGLPGLRRIRLRLNAPGQYALALRAVQMTLPDLPSLNVTITIQIGDDVFTHPGRMLVKRGGARFVMARSTTTTLIVTVPTTTTSMLPLTTSSTSTSSTSSSSTSTLDTTTTTSSTIDTTTTTSSTIDTTTTTSSTIDTTTTTSSTTIDTSTTTSSTTLDSTTTTTSSTTTTTLAACGDLISPACGLGGCPVGEECVDGGLLNPCVCQLIGLPTTTTTSSTTIDTSTTTSSTIDASTTTSTSSTTTTTLAACGDLISPACALGACPVGEECTDGGLLNPCVCQPIAVPTTTTTSSTIDTTTTTSSTTIDTSTTTSSTTNDTSTTTSSTIDTSTTTSTSSTTSTTLLACGDLISPACALGSCPVGDECADGGLLNPCVCQPIATPTTTTTSSTIDTTTTTSSTIDTTTTTSSTTIDTSTTTSSTTNDTSTTTSSTIDTSTTTSTSSTTSTTLLACGDLISPACALGSCPVGEECADGGLLQPCVCQPIAQPTTTSTSSTIDTTTTTSSTTIDTSTTTSSTTSDTSTTTSSTIEPTTTSTSSTTSSTLVACGTLTEPACGLGGCPVGETCVSGGLLQPCVCQP
jgi:hypothetical protein